LDALVIAHVVGPVEVDPPVEEVAHLRPAAEAQVAAPLRIVEDPLPRWERLDALDRRDRKGSLAEAVAPLCQVDPCATY